MKNNRSNPYRTLDTTPVKAPLNKPAKEPSAKKTVASRTNSKGGK